jgi:hypothetical protein
MNNNAYPKSLWTVSIGVWTFHLSDKLMIYHAFDVEATHLGYSSSTRRRAVREKNVNHNEIFIF